MTEFAHRSSPDPSRCRSLLARLAAVERALEALEHDVRDVEHQPDVRLGPVVRRPLSIRRPAEGRQHDPLVVEVAA